MLLTRLFRRYSHKIARDITLNKALYLLLIFFSVLFFLLYKSYGIAWDETDNMALGDHALAFYKSLGRDTSVLTFYTQPGFAPTHGPFIETIRAGVMNLTGRYSMNDYHLILALFSLLGFYFAYKTVFLLTKSKALGIVSALLLFFTPRFFGDIFNNSKDISPVYLLFAGIYFSTKLLKTKKTDIYNSVVFGALIGIGFTLRIALAYIIPLFMIVSLKDVFRKRLSFTVYLSHTLWILLSFIVFSHITHPYLLTHPFTGYMEMINYSIKFPQIEHMLFAGKTIVSTQAPWYYLPQWIFISTPLPTLMFVFVGIFFLFSKRDRKNKTELIYLVGIFLTPLIVVLLVRPNIYDAWRHFLFLIAPMTILASMGLYYFFKSILLYKIMALCILLSIFLSVGYSYLALHPYEYIYFNAVVGGLKGAYQHYETDYWGKSYREAVLQFESKVVKEQTKTITILTCGHPVSSTYYFLPNMHWVSDPSKAQYYICYTRYHQDENISGSKTLFTVQRQGTPLNFIKKIHHE